MAANKMWKTHSIPVQLIFSWQLIMLFSEAPYQLLCPNLRHLELKTYHFLTHKKKTLDKMNILRDDFLGLLKIHNIFEVQHG